MLAVRFARKTGPILTNRFHKRSVPTGVGIPMLFNREQERSKMLVQPRMPFAFCPSPNAIANAKTFRRAGLGWLLRLTNGYVFAFRSRSNCRSRGWRKVGRKVNLLAWRFKGW